MAIFCGCASESLKEGREEQDGYVAGIMAVI